MEQDLPHGNGRFIPNRFLDSSIEDIITAVDDGVVDIHAKTYPAMEPIATLIISKLDEDNEHIVLEALNTLVEKGEEFNDEDLLESPLRAAVMKNNTKVVEFLIKHGADPNTQSKTTSSTVLHTAIYEDHPEMIFTIEAACNLRGLPLIWDPSTISGVTPLSAALEKGFVDLAAYLVRCGAETRTHIPRLAGTPAEFAATKGYQEVLTAIEETEAARAYVS